MKFESLRSARDFARVVGSQRARRDGITLHWAVHPQATAPPRVGFAIPASVGPAVVRNRVRRRLRAILAELPQRSGIDVVVRAAPAVVHRDFGQIRADVRALWERAG